MCGICGIVRLGRPPEVAAVRAMTHELRHRGPDGQGLFEAPGVALGHARLAIIDLSDAGRQPFASEDGSLQLLHNGEIFNYLELRDELAALGHRFRSQTDTEVIIAGYEEWGDQCFTHFNGMWAIALWDARRERLLCSRDRFGIKPFYYRWDGARFAFASEPRAFRRDPEARFEPNLLAIREFLDLRHSDHRDDTFFAGINQLPAAHSLVLDDSGIHLSRYWKLEPSPEPQAIVEAVREMFIDSVRLRLRSDVPLGTALSGGLDSSAVAVTIDHLLHTEAAAARPVGDRQQTFTAYFEDAGHDERKFADAVASQILAQPHTITFDDRVLVDVLPQIVESQGEPFASSSIVAQWFVMKAAREAGLKVMLDGQGGDEVLAGYPRITWAYRFADLAAHGRLTTLAGEARASGLSAGGLAEAFFTPLVPEALRASVRSRRGDSNRLVHGRLRSLSAPLPRRVGGPFRDRLRTHYHGVLSQFVLPELLRYEDRNTMAHSLEGRVPFLDHRFVELMYGLPAEALIRDGAVKVALRDALSDLLPAPVRDRRDKVAFLTPETRFLQGALGSFAHDVFSAPATRSHAFVNQDEAVRRVAAVRSGRPVGLGLWRALSVELWARAYLD